MTLDPTHPRRALARAYRLLGRHGAWLWPSLLISLATAFVLREREHVARIGGVLHDADPRWLLGAILIQLAVLWLTALTYQALLRRLGHPLTLPSLAGLHLQRVVVGTITPVGGPLSLCVLVRHLRRRGVPAEDALLAAALRSVLGYAAFVVLLVPALALNGPSDRVLLGAGLAVGLFAVIAGGLHVLLGRPGASRRLPRVVPGRVRGFVERAGSHGVRSGDLLRPFGFALAIRLAGAAMLYVSLRAVGEDPAPHTALAAYAIGMLVLFLTPIFQGIGVVEVAISVALERMGVPGATAFGAALLCRLGELWLPLAFGLLVQTLVATRAARPLPAPAHARAAANRW